MASKKYCLLVGITDYRQDIYLDGGRVLFPKLEGCVNDCKTVISFLQEFYPVEDMEIVTLFNKDATKQNICDTFLNHLGKAGEKDSVLFYFSGHGTQEYANECFITETDRKLECLVGYYDNTNKENSFISDKELRYLINIIGKNKPHITIINDCCHSGDMTRNLEIVSKNYDAPIQKKSYGTYTFPNRDWRKFIFANEISPDDIKKNGLKQVIPLGRHIAFSGAQSHESAYEIGGEGIFTKHLVQWLKRSGGYISYRSLFDKVTMQMKYGYKQSPAIYTPETFNDLKDSGFLNNELIDNSEGAAVILFNRAQNVWKLNRGLLNGVALGYNFEVDDGSGDILKATISAVKFNEADIIFNKDLDVNKVLNKDLSLLQKSLVYLFPNLEGMLPKESLEILDQLQELRNEEVKIESTEEDAEYVIHTVNDKFYISKQNDKWRPISCIFSLSQFSSIIKELKTISSWKFINNLGFQSQNTSEIPTKHGIEVHYKIGNNPEQEFDTVQSKNSIEIKDWKYPEGRPYNTLQIKLKNTTNGDLYIAVLYLDVNYYSHTFLLEPSPYVLKPQEEVSLNVQGDPELPFEFYKNFIYYNHEKYFEKFKIIYDHEVFDIDSLKLEGISEPLMPGRIIRSEAEKGVSRSAREEAMRRNTRMLTGIIDINICAINPSYNQIPSTMFEEMINDPDTKPFAAGLFFNFDETNSELPFSFGGELKPEIQIVEEIQGEELSTTSKNAIIDIANWWSRRKRNAHYDYIVSRYPERIKIVSEGDSWFQHPLVMDTIDHLSSIYAVRCAAAAADTLKNYFSNQHKRGEYFLDVLEDVKPKFFILSGGGNDILGKQFRDFLVDANGNTELVGKTNISRFVNDSLNGQIDFLMKLYHNIFGLLKQRFPEMVTIVHGYDYPVKLDETNKWWLGRYMIEKGITSPDDRRSLIKYILDCFNEKLKIVVDEFPDTVVYIDLRGTVKSLEKDGVDQWYDEIHPNDDGFQLVALQFIKAIQARL